MTGTPTSPALQALVVAARGVPASLEWVHDSDLGSGEVTIEVAWSSLNYKDALALTGTAPVVRHFPMICGIDLAGRVIASTDPAFTTGDAVLVTGCGLGDEHPGGYATRARVPASWCVPVPERLSPRDAMTLGTAGLTAMLAIEALERNGVSPARLGTLPVLVTGAAGGVGTLATYLLATLGYRVLAATGRSEHAAFLHSLGASEIIARSDVLCPERAALGRERFGAAIDVVGGTMLADVLRQTGRGGVVAVCGLVGGHELPTTVYPLILRGITIAGIDSTPQHLELRERAWERLGALAEPEALNRISQVAPLSSALDLAGEILGGRTRGRIVIDVGS